MSAFEVYACNSFDESRRQFDMRLRELSLNHHVKENKTNRYTTQVTPLISLQALVALVFIYRSDRHVYKTAAHRR